MNWKTFWIGMGMFLLVGFVLAELTSTTTIIKDGVYSSGKDLSETFLGKELLIETDVDCNIFSCEQISFQRDEESGIEITKDGKYLNNSGANLLTMMSVVCAERTTITTSWYVFLYSSGCRRLPYFLKSG